MKDILKATLRSGEVYQQVGTDNAPGAIRIWGIVKHIEYFDKLSRGPVWIITIGAVDAFLYCEEVTYDGVPWTKDSVLLPVPVAVNA